MKKSISEGRNISITIPIFDPEKNDVEYVASIEKSDAEWQAQLTPR